VSGGEYRIACPFRYRACAFRYGAPTALQCPNGVQIWGRAAPAVSKGVHHGFDRRCHGAALSNRVAFLPCQHREPSVVNRPEMCVWEGLVCAVDVSSFCTLADGVVVQRINCTNTGIFYQVWVELRGSGQEGRIVREYVSKRAEAHTGGAASADCADQRGPCGAI
jgi:hypothetical protein